VLEMEKMEGQAAKNDLSTLQKKYSKLEELLQNEQKGFNKSIESKNKEITENNDIASKNIRMLENRLASTNEKLK
jgi:hypothetical protein